MSIEKFLKQEKLSRQDAHHYIGDLLIRQRHINQSVFTFASALLPPSGTVLDACAGPEGSLTAASLRQLDWIGNDISKSWVKNLISSGADKVVISDFSKNPYADNKIDVTAFIYALHNVCNTPLSLTQAERITKPNGLVIISDPGPSIWSTNILLSSVKKLDKNFYQFLKGKVFQKEIPDFFTSKQYTLQEYSNHYLKNLLGINDHQLVQLAHLALDKAQSSKAKLKSLPYYFNNLATSAYFQFIHQSAQDNHLTLERSGFLVAAVDDQDDQNDSRWTVTNAYPLKIQSICNPNYPPHLWINQAATQSSQFSLVAKKAKKIISPVLIYRKPQI